MTGNLKLEIGNWSRIGIAASAGFVCSKSFFLISNFKFRLFLLVCLFLPTFFFLFAQNNCAAQDHKWRAPMAECCFEMKITARPTDPGAGIVAIVPDCGLLPKNQFKAEVFDENGKLLKHEFLWHNPKEGMAVVFEPAESEKVFIYVSAFPEKMRFVSAFRPSLLLYVRNGDAGLEGAHTLADKPPVGDDIFFTVVESIFHSLSPVGRDDNSSSYYTGWFIAKKPGKTYFYTCSKDGSEFFIDGKLGYSWPGIHGRDNYAGKGQWINLGAGLHRIEYFHFNASFAGREAHLGWQLPGERQSDDPKFKGRKNLDVTGPMPPEDFIHSGRTKLIRAFSKKGPLAIFYPAWESIIQPGKEPVCLFRFEPFGVDEFPKTAVCSWDFGKGRIVKGTNVLWLFGGYADQSASLNISIGGYNSRAARVFFPKSQNPARDPPRVSILKSGGRAQFRAVYQSMVSATPEGKRPCEDWNDAMWEGFAAVLDQDTEPSFLSAIVERSGNDLKRVAGELRWKIEQRIIEITRRTDPKKVILWIDIFEKDEKDDKHIAYWKAKKVELALYDLNDLALARKYLGRFADNHDDKYASALRLIRMGDVERFSGNFEAARRFYAQAQELHDVEDAVVGDAEPAQPAATMGFRRRSESYGGQAAENQGSAGAKTQTASKRHKERSAGTNAALSKKTGGALPKNLPVIRTETLMRGTNDWRTLAVQEAAYYVSVRNLIDQDAYEEARATLDKWELEFPMTKLTGDYPLAEALYYIVLDNYRAAVSILANYRATVEISNELPRAMRMELYCLVKMGRDKEARDLARAIIERLPRHEMADEMRNILARDESEPLIIDLDLHSREWTASEKVDSSLLARLFATNKTAVVKIMQEESDPQKSADQSGRGRLK